jgi:uncharacterized small protein (DUF1192 family)
MSVGAWVWSTHGDNILHALIRDHVATEEMMIVAEFEERVAQLQQENAQLQQKAAHVSELEAQVQAASDFESQLAYLREERDEAARSRDQLQQSVQQISKLSLIEK